MDFVAYSDEEVQKIYDGLAVQSLLFKTVFGSNLYGTNTPTSDKDYKAVFLPSLEQLLRGGSLKNVMQKTNHSKTAKNTAEDVDYEFVPVQVFARDFMEGQTYALELAFAALASDQGKIECVAHPIFVGLCEELVEEFLTSNIRAMMGYALGQAHKYGIKGSRLGTVKKFDAILQKYADKKGALKDFPSFVEEVKASSDKYLFLTEYEGPNGQQAPAISLLEKIYPLDIPMSEAVGRTQKLLDSYGNRAEQAMAAEGVDWKAVSHAVRISYQALDVLQHHTIVLPFDEQRRDYLLAIKKGERPWDEVEDHLADVMAQVDDWKTKTTLPEKTPAMVEKFDAWLMKTNVFLYNLEDHLMNRVPRYKGVEV